MSASSKPSGRIVLHGTPSSGNREIEKREQRILDWIALLNARQFAKQPVHIQEYKPYLTAPSNWLSHVESRIRESIMPYESDEYEPAEWLTAEAAMAAIGFFQSSVDDLPGEPHIYATNKGDLVAEFESPNGTLTSVVTEQRTILFAVTNENPEAPIEKVIRRGSNTFHDELRSVTKHLRGTHGKMESAK
jgi:hypothetical protein